MVTRTFFFFTLAIGLISLFTLWLWTRKNGRTGLRPQSLRRLLAQTHVDGTVLVLSFNYAYLDMFENFVCHLPPDQKFLIAAQDQALYDIISEEYPTYLLSNDISSSAHNFREGDFNKITMAKLRSVKKILQEGYNVIFSDVDVVWLEDNWNAIKDEQYDFVFQPNTVNADFSFDLAKHELNSGIYYMKSNNRTIYLLEYTEELSKKNPAIDDQTLLTQALREHDGMINYRALDMALFPTGLYLWQQRSDFEAKLKERGREKPALVHANFLFGKQAKIDHLKKEKLWCE